MLARARAQSHTHTRTHARMYAHARTQNTQILLPPLCHEMCRSNEFSISYADIRFPHKLFIMNHTGMPAMVVCEQKEHLFLLHSYSSFPVVVIVMLHAPTFNLNLFCPLVSWMVQDTPLLLQCPHRPQGRTGRDLQPISPPLSNNSPTLTSSLSSLLLYVAV